MYKILLAMINWDSFSGAFFHLQAKNLILGIFFLYLSQFRIKKVWMANKWWHKNHKSKTYGVLLFVYIYIKLNLYFMKTIYSVFIKNAIFLNFYDSYHSIVHKYKYEINGMHHALSINFRSCYLLVWTFLQFKISI